MAISESRVCLAAFWAGIRQNERFLRRRKMMINRLRLRSRFRSTPLAWSGNKFQHFSPLCREKSQRFIFQVTALHPKSSDGRFESYRNVIATLVQRDAIRRGVRASAILTAVSGDGMTNCH